jgi:glycosyltransferase involved in cell wall biosynthesis
VYDLYFTFDPPSMRLLNKFPQNKKITGTTSHTYTNMKGVVDLFGQAGHLHANSKMLQAEIEKLTKREVHYLPNGVDEILFTLKDRNPEDTFQVGYVGKNTERKGYQKFVVEACKQAGVTLKSQVCRFNDRKVIKHNSIHNFYNDVDCIIVASDMDGTPNQLLEAASSGRTFIGNAIGNVPEFVNDGVNGFLVEREVQAYVDKIT